MSQTQPPTPKFVQITAANLANRHVGLYALDEEGGVWHYMAADNEKGQYAFWTKLTGYRRNPADKSTSKTSKPTDKST